MKKYFLYLLIFMTFISCSEKKIDERIKSCIIENKTAELSEYCKKHPDLIKQNGSTYLSYAIHPVNEDAIYILLQNLAVETVNIALENAVIADNFEILEVLMNKGGNINIKDKQGLTLFDLALINHNYKTAEILLTKESYIRYLQNHDQIIMQYIISSWNNTISTSFVTRIFPEGIDLSNDSYLIIEAIEKCNSDAVRWLVSNGCNPLTVEYSSYFDANVLPIDYAYEKEHKFLIFSEQSDSYEIELKEIRKIIDILSNYKL